METALHVASIGVILLFTGIVASVLTVKKLQLFIIGQIFLRAYTVKKEDSGFLIFAIENDVQDTVIDNLSNILQKKFGDNFVIVSGSPVRIIEIK